MAIKSLDKALPDWRRQILWPVIWVLTVYLICKGLTIRSASGGSNNSPGVAVHNGALVENEKYYSAHSNSIDMADPAFNPNIFLNVSSSPKVAVIIETRSPGYIVPLILHFSAVLGPSWPIIVYTEAENYGRFSTSASFIRLQKSGRVNVRSLPEGLYFPNWASVSDFLTDTWLWKNLAPAENILIFQADSILCSNSVRSVDDFLSYDMIGAPIIARFGKGYNGGLSLRRRSTFLKVLDQFEYGPRSRPHMEDQWFYLRILDLQQREEAEGIEDGIKLPSMEIARTFAVETIDYPRPLGFHQPMRFIKNHMVSIDEYCPEYKLATKSRITNRPA